MNTAIRSIPKERSMDVSQVSLLAAAMTVNAKYAAYAFYQQREGRPLTSEEMEEIATGIINEIGTTTKQFVTALSGGADVD